tara:strand:+ start:6268 stop:6834 length:567 start_codon:yes stop_codon:yes gene_type:complete
MDRPVRIYLVRHAKTAEPWRTALDAPLSSVGLEQAERAAQDLSPLGPLPLFSSPLQRARQTAAPLADLWQTEIRIEPRVTEIPAPSADPKERGDWLMRILTAKWSAMEYELVEWRDGVLDAITAIQEDTIIVTHYVVINAVVGAATDDDRVISFHPDNTDTTVIDKSGDRLSVAGYTLKDVSDPALVT